MENTNRYRLLRFWLWIGLAFFLGGCVGFVLGLGVLAAIINAIALP